MIIGTNTYLKYINLSHLVNWSVQGLNNTQLSYTNQFKFSRIGDFINKSKNLIKIEDKKTYSRITVKINNNGVILRDKLQGNLIGTKKQFLAKAGQFIISRIDARNGAFGIIPDSLNNAIVTNDFPLFDINIEVINPQFLLLITTTQNFINFAQSCSSGTTNRQRMDIDLFLNQIIPLPSLLEQEVIVNNYFNKIEEAANLEKKVYLLQEEINFFLLDKLGIESDRSLKRTIGNLYIVNYSELHKWGLDFIGKESNSVKKYNELPIKYFCKVSSGGTPSRSRKDFYDGGSIPWIKTGELRHEILYNSEEKITPNAIKNSSAKLYPKDSILIAMYGATIGKTAKLGIEAATNQACAVLFNIDRSIIIPDYLWEFLQLQTDNLKKLAYGSAQPNLNAGIISNYLVPVPSLEEQSIIVKQIAILKKEIKYLKEESANLKYNAKKEFEIEIFNSYL